MNSAPHEQETRSGLLSASFLGLLLTQFLTAVNDNVFRWLVIGVGKDYVDPKNIGAVLMAGTLCFVFPYLFLAAPAGYLADRFSKRSVVVGCKVAEILIMALGVGAIVIGNMYLLFVAVALTGAQSALFGPAKLGSIPELLRTESISIANGLFGLTTVGATVIGMGIGSWLADETGDKGQEHWQLSAAVVLGIAVVGTALSLLIRKLPAANPTKRFPWNAAYQTWLDLRVLFTNRALLRVAVGTTFFWSVGSLAQLNIDQFAAEGGALSETAKIPLLFALVFGVGLGSVLAGVWSAGRVELGILPLGAGGIAIASMLLFIVHGEIIDPQTFWTFGYIVAMALLFVLGGSAGLFNVPLESFLQHRSPPESRGSVLAATNFLTFAGVMVSGALFSGLRLPIWEGKLENVPAALRGEPLSADATQQVDALVQRFTKQVRGDTPAAITDLLPEVDEAARPAALARLLWTELKVRRERKDFLRKQDYLDAYPDHQPLVRYVFDQSGKLPLFTSQMIFLLAGIGTIPVFVYIVWLIPQASIRFLVWLASRTVYRIRVFGRENLPDEGGALLVANHVSWLDGVLLLLTSSRPVRMIVWAGNFENRFLKWLADLYGAILINSRPKSIVAALRTAREAILNGELVCIFPEGAITRTGQIQAFKPGLLKILDGTNAPVIPIYLDQLWGSIFSFQGGSFFWKWPQRWPYPVSIHFGRPLPTPDDAFRVRQAVQDLGAEAVQQRMESKTQLSRVFVRGCKQRKWRSIVADTLGSDFTGGQMLMRSLILRRLLRRKVLQPGEQYVGLLLPPTAGGAAANMALALDRRVAVNLNYTVSSDVMNACIAAAGIKHVLTTRKFMERFSFDLRAEVVYLDDFKDQVTLVDKAVCAAAAYAVPSGVLERWLSLDKVQADDVLTIIFTSGSTGEPKGVMLTYGNVASNIEAIDTIVQIGPDDVVIGILPFFHSFGYTVTLWTSMAINGKAAYHVNPLDARQVGKLCKEHRGTLLLSTPTFLRTYLRRCEPEDLASLEIVVAGAEKLPKDLSDAFEEKFGVRPVEGYGATELSPLVSVNVPPTRAWTTEQVSLKEGTVGRPVPGVHAKVIHPESGAELGANTPGMLLIKGPNVMKGYLNRPDLTAKVLRDGWYVTGDIAMIDEDGFITITGRESRFSKIGGEMVPHIKIEEELNRILATGDEEALKAAVTAVPDSKKGERLIVVHTALPRTPSDLCQALSAAGLPNLFIPGTDSFMEVAELPVLGSGKLDLKGIRQLALEKFGEQ